MSTGKSPPLGLWLDGASDIEHCVLSVVLDLAVVVVLGGSFRKRCSSSACSCVVCAVLCFGDAEGAWSKVKGSSVVD